ncbi:MAG: phosphatase [Tissierellia bacterium]|nr:phosphatase [Tissierellia bacterium]
MYGVVDIGSNTIRLNIYKVHEDDFTLVLKNKIYAGLAGYINDGRLSMEGIQKASSVLYEFKKITDNLNIKDILIFATASIRNISNSNEARLIIEKLTGLKIDILSESDEGTLGYKGAIFDVNTDYGVLVDIGGSSTEIVNFSDQKIISALSTRMGSLNMFINHVENILPDKREIKNMRKSATEILEGIYLGDKSLELVGVGGTIRACLNINNYINKLDKSNRKISIEQLDDILDRFSGDFNSKKEIILKVCPERVHTIIPGLCILKSIVKKFPIKGIIVSEYGVREGYLWRKVISN